MSGPKMVTMKESDLRRAIHLMLNDDDGIDLALRILMPVVGLRRPLWDFDGVKGKAVDELFGPNKEPS